MGELSGRTLNTIALLMLGIVVLLYVSHTNMLWIETRALYEASYDLRRGHGRWGMSRSSRWGK